MLTASLLTLASGDPGPIDEPKWGKERRFLPSPPTSAAGKYLVRQSQVALANPSVSRTAQHNLGGEMGDERNYKKK